MRRVRIELEVELPTGYDEAEIDEAIANTIYDLGGQVLDSKEYKDLEEEDDE